MYKKQLKANMHCEGNVTAKYKLVHMATVDEYALHEECYWGEKYNIRRLLGSYVGFVDRMSRSETGCTHTHTRARARTHTHTHTHKTHFFFSVNEQVLSGYHVLLTMTDSSFAK